MMSRKWKFIVLFLLVAVLIGVNVFRPFTPQTANPGAELGEQDTNASHAIPDATFDTALLEAERRIQARDIERNIFQYGHAPARSQPVPSTGPVEASTTPPPPPPKPKPPLQFFGFAEGTTGSGQRVFLTDGENIFIARQGDLVMERFRVIQVDAESVQIRDTGGQLEWVLPLQQP